MDRRQVRLVFVGIGHDIRPDIDADVIRETRSQIVLEHPALGAKPVRFSRTNGFSVGAYRIRGVGHIGYKLPFEEMKWSRS